MRLPLNWDRLDSSGRVRGPIIVPINQVYTDPNQIDTRTVRYYIKTNTQVWYAQPITCTVDLLASENPLEADFEANGVHAHSQVEACRQIGYKDLQICYVVVI